MTTSRTTTTRRRIDLADIVDELTRSHTERSRYEIRGRGRTTRSRYKVVSVPSLIHQLEHAVPHSTRDERSAGGYQSRPTANVDAFDTWLRIDREARTLLEQLREPTHGTTTACVRRLFRAAPGDRAVARELRRWWAQARVVSGWDAPAWRPRSSCPMCGETGGLRIRRDDKVGMCVDCGETWDPDTIGLLAEHIRLEAEFTARRRPVDLPVCWCPLPMPDVTTLRLCPTCGSARCVRALTQPYTQNAVS